MFDRVTDVSVFEKCSNSVFSRPDDESQTLPRLRKWVSFQRKDRRRRSVYLSIFLFFNDDVQSAKPASSDSGVVADSKRRQSSMDQGMNNSRNNVQVQDD